MTDDADGPSPDPGRDALECGPRGPARKDGRGSPRESRRGARAPEKRFNWMVLLLANALPVGMAVWILTMPAERRQRLFDQIPSGVVARAGAALGALLLMVVFARLVLPAAKGSLAALLRAQAWFRGKRGAARVALYPAEVAVGLAWFVVQMLFAVDLVLILACAAGFVLYAVRIVKPEMFDWLPGPR